MILRLMTGLKFQSTLPRRERREPASFSYVCWSFNPRSREGSDNTGDSNSHGIAISFNPRSREGSDNVYLNDNTALIVSIHAPAKGATTI